MGRPKALLDFRGESLLHRVVRIVGEVAAPVVVVAAPAQAVDVAGVRVVHDPVEGQGPLVGIAAGLAAIAAERRFAFVAAVDLPFVTADFIAALATHLGPETQAIAPVVDGIAQPLASIYATALHAQARALLEAGERSAQALLAAGDALRIDAGFDPGCLRNVNTPEDYAAALACLP